MKNLDHPHVIKIFEWFESKKEIYIIMEFLGGGELFDKIKSEKHLSEKKAAEIMKCLLEAISYLHTKNIVHRDIKPENIVFNNRGTLKLVDFGTSRVIKNKNMNKTHGTPYYIAPEVLNENYNEKCDVWSSGIIFYILLSGIPPFNGRNDNEILERVVEGYFNFKPPTFKGITS